MVLSTFEACSLDAFFIRRQDAVTFPGRWYAENKVYLRFPLRRVRTVEKRPFNMAVELRKKVCEPLFDFIV